MLEIATVHCNALLTHPLQALRCTDVLYYCTLSITFLCSSLDCTAHCAGEVVSLLLKVAVYAVKELEGEQGAAKHSEGRSGC